jgi:transposase
MRRAPAFTVSDADRKVLESWARGRRNPARQVLRAKIVLLASEGLENQVIASRLGTTKPTVGLWRRRFASGGILGISKDARRGGRPANRRRELESEIVARTTAKRADDTQWTTRSLAAELGTTRSMVQRVWVANGLRPHRVRRFKLSNDPHFVEKLLDVAGLYLNPPEHALVLSADEKSQIQALDRTQPGLPMKRGRCGTMTHDYKRNGTTTLFAALNMADGKVIASCEDRHRHQEWLRFLRRIHRETPPELDIHLIVDNYATHKHPKVRLWLDRHPRFHLHFIPTSSSWLNVIEGFFAQLTNRRLRRGVFRSVPDLVDAIESYVARHNEAPKPFMWTASAESILDKVGRARAALDGIKQEQSGSHH